jgi:hypothetical protein
MKAYIGDGVYVDWDGNHLILTTENGIEVTNTIYLSSLEWAALLQYVVPIAIRGWKAE